MNDPDPGAARSAQPEERGLIARLISAFGPEDQQDDAAGDAPPESGLHALRGMRIEDVAIPKVEIDAVPVDIDLPDLVERFRRNSYTRLPVFEGTLDSPIGLVHLKDLALRHGFGSEADYDLRAMVRPLIYAPPSMPVGVLLQRMQADRMHMALMIDEYGGVDGLVTLEDLIEQIIGEIEDEHDQAEGALFAEEAPGVYTVRARAPLAEFEARTGRSLTDGIDDEDVDTLGGLVFLLTGRVPARGEVIPHPSGPEIEVIDADPRRIKRLRVRFDGRARAAAE